MDAGRGPDKEETARLQDWRQLTTLQSKFWCPPPVYVGQRKHFPSPAAALFLSNQIPRQIAVASFS